MGRRHGPEALLGPLRAHKPFDPVRDPRNGGAITIEDDYRLDRIPWASPLEDGVST